MNIIILGDYNKHQDMDAHMMIYENIFVRLVHPVEAEMDEAIANARTSQGQESFDETYLTELCVKQKYMGHRNARYELYLIVKY